MITENTRDVAERVASEFHETYERLAPQHGYETREASARPWSEVPEQNRGLMVAVVAELLDRGVIMSQESVRVDERCISEHCDSHDR